MSEIIREQISALLDDELPGKDVDPVIAQLRECDELRQAWGRYHLIGDAIRGEAAVGVYPDIAARVRERLESEPAILAAPRAIPQPKPQTSPWIRPLAGLALAASVAVLTILAAPRWIGVGPDAGTGLAQQPVQPVASPAVGTTAVAQVAVPAAANRFHQGQYGTRWRNLGEPAVESKLNNYLVNHSEYAAQGGMKDMMPYATFISYDANQ